MNGLFFLEYIYSVTKDSWCAHSNTVYGTSLSEAKEKCGFDKTCVGFYYGGSSIHRYTKCTEPLDTSERIEAILYLKKGKIGTSYNINYYLASQSLY